MLDVWKMIASEAVMFASGKNLIFEPVLMRRCYPLFIFNVPIQGFRKLNQDFRYASQLLLTPGLPLSSRHIAHIRHTSVDVLRLLPFLALAVLPGGSVVRTPSHVLCFIGLYVSACFVAVANSPRVATDGPAQAIAAAVKFAPWLLPSPFQQKQVASLMTSPAQTLTPLTQQELLLQQKRRQQLYGGLSEGLRVAVQVKH
jgi:hypothetical protein